MLINTVSDDNVKASPRRRLGTEAQRLRGEVLRISLRVFAAPLRLCSSEDVALAVRAYEKARALDLGQALPDLAG